MPLHNIFKKKRIKEKPKEAIREEKEIHPVKSEKKKEKIVRGPIPAVLKSPHITEKAADLVKKNQYVFKVVPKANKTEIKKAIKSLYGIDVLKIRIINVPGKPRRLGKQAGWRKGYKKAIITIKEGQKIEVLQR